MIKCKSTVIHISGRVASNYQRIFQICDTLALLIVAVTHDFIRSFFNTALRRLFASCLNVFSWNIFAVMDPRLIYRIFLNLYSSL